MGLAAPEHRGDPARQALSPPPRPSHADPAPLHWEARLLPSGRPGSPHAGFPLPAILVLEDMLS